MNKVSNQLWLTDISRVMTDDVAHFDLVLTVCEDDISELVDSDYKQFALPSATLSKESAPVPFEKFAEAADTLYRALADGETVLTHCHSGTSRSVAVAGAAFARHREIDFGEALQLIKEARPSADPSEAYRTFAKDYVTKRQPQTH
jgi:protein-tyrosine phosphatase